MRGSFLYNHHRERRVLERASCTTVPIDQIGMHRLENPTVFKSHSTFLAKIDQMLHSNPEDIYL